MVAYKVKMLDGSWYTLGSTSGAVAKIRRADGTWAADSGAGLLAKVRKTDGTMAAGVDFSTGGSISETAWADALEPTALVQVDPFYGTFTSSSDLEWSPVGSSPWVASDDGGYILQRDRVDFAPRYAEPLGILPAFNIRDYAWFDGSNYRLRGGVRWEVGGGNTRVSGFYITLRLWDGSDWGLTYRRSFSDTSLAINSPSDVVGIPWTWATEADLDVGGTYYEAAAAGNLSIGTELSGDYQSSMFYDGPQSLIVWALVLLPPPSGETPLSAGD